MNKIYKLIIESPAFPKGTLAIYKDEYLEKSYYSPNTYLIFFPEDHEQKFKRGIIYKEAVENRPEVWELQEQKIDLRLHEAEIKREGARSKRWDFIPNDSDRYYYYDLFHKNVTYNFWNCNGDNVDYTLWNMGNCHRTREEALAWGEKYARYFLTE